MENVDSGQYSENTFIYDGVGFGLAKWTYRLRKQALYNKCKGKIGNLKCQLEYLVDELKTYFGDVYRLLIKSNDINKCTIIVLKRFESPADTGEFVQQVRTKLAKQYYDEYQSDKPLINN